MTETLRLAVFDLDYTIWTPGELGQLIFLNFEYC
jgi:hypothetical protein